MSEEIKTPHEPVVRATDSQSDDVATGEDGRGTDNGLSSEVPWTMKFIAVLLITIVGFGSHWSSGVTGAMKTTLKKVNGARLVRVLDVFCDPALADNRRSAVRN